MTWFYPKSFGTGSMIFLMFILGPQKIKISQRCCETDQHSDDCDKGICSVSNILFEHGMLCLATNLLLSGK